MVKLISPDSSAKLAKSPALILLDFLYNNWITTPDNTNFPNVPIKSEVAFGYHWAERQRADKSITLRTRQEPEAVFRKLVPHLYDFQTRVWVDFYIRVLDSEFSTTMPQLPPDRLTAMKDYIIELVDSNYNGLANQGIHEMVYERWDEIPNPDESNVFHGIVFVKLLYRLVAAPNP